MDIDHLGPFNRLVGLVVTEAEPDGITATLEIRPDHHQPYGIVHGGVLCTLVETVGSISGALNHNGPVVGVSNHTNFLRATREGTLTAKSTPIHRGRTTQLWDIEITDANGRAIARGQLRLANLDEGGENVGR